MDHPNPIHVLRDGEMVILVSSTDARNLETIRAVLHETDYNAAFAVAAGDTDDDKNRAILTQSLANAT